jgi:hypothetical protein
MTRVFYRAAARVSPSTILRIRLTSILAAMRVLAATVASMIA